MPLIASHLYPAPYDYIDTVCYSMERLALQLEINDDIKHLLYEEQLGALCSWFDVYDFKWYMNE